MNSQLDFQNDPRVRNRQAQANRRTYKIGVSLALAIGAIFGITACSDQLNQPEIGVASTEQTGDNAGKPTGSPSADPTNPMGVGTTSGTPSAPPTTSATDPSTNLQRVEGVLASTFGKDYGKLTIAQMVCAYPLLDKNAPNKAIEGIKASELKIADAQYSVFCKSPLSSFSKDAANKFGDVAVLWAAAIKSEGTFESNDAICFTPKKAQGGIDAYGDGLNIIEADAKSVAFEGSRTRFQFLTAQTVLDKKGINDGVAEVNAAIVPIGQCANAVASGQHGLGR